MAHAISVGSSESLRYCTEGWAGIYNKNIDKFSAHAFRCVKRLEITERDGVVAKIAKVALTALSAVAIIPLVAALFAIKAALFATQHAITLWNTEEINVAGEEYTQDSGVEYVTKTVASTGQAALVIQNEKAEIAPQSAEAENAREPVPTTQVAAQEIAPQQVVAQDEVPQQVVAEPRDVGDASQAADPQARENTKPQAAITQQMTVNIEAARAANVRVAKNLLALTRVFLQSQHLHL